MGKKHHGPPAALKLGSPKEPTKLIRSSISATDDIGNLVSDSLVPPSQSISKIFWEGLCQDSPIPVKDCPKKVIGAFSSPTNHSKIASISGSRTLGESDTESEFMRPSLGIKALADLGFRVMMAVATRTKK
ncbi:hypothetical protein Fot_15625 [Forsythia ovata]|uniref:Uncharacterized protein n=1 Tax=Forsythia ovata TaxID=205694 RepID=A0ABD1WA12_9LAMI